MMDPDMEERSSRRRSVLKTPAALNSSMEDTAGLTVTRRLQRRVSFNKHYRVLEFCKDVVPLDITDTYQRDPRLTDTSSDSSGAVPQHNVTMDFTEPMSTRCWPVAATQSSAATRRSAPAPLLGHPDKENQLPALSVSASSYSLPQQQQPGAHYGLVLPTSTPSFLRHIPRPTTSTVAGQAAPLRTVSSTSTSCSADMELTAALPPHVESASAPRLSLVQRMLDFQRGNVRPAVYSAGVEGGIDGGSVADVELSCDGNDSGMELTGVLGRPVQPRRETGNDEPDGCVMNTTVCADDNSMEMTLNTTTAHVGSDSVMDMTTCGSSSPVDEVMDMTCAVNDEAASAPSGDTRCVGALSQSGPAQLASSVSVLGASLGSSQLSGMEFTEAVSLSAAAQVLSGAFVKCRENVVSSTNVEESIASGHTSNMETTEVVQPRLVQASGVVEVSQGVTVAAVSIGQTSLMEMTASVECRPDLELSRSADLIADIPCAALNVDSSIAITSGVDSTEDVIHAGPELRQCRLPADTGNDHVADDRNTSRAQISNMEMTEAVEPLFCRRSSENAAREAAEVPASTVANTSFGNASGMELTEAVVFRASPRNDCNVSQLSSNDDSNTSGMEMTEAVLPRWHRGATGELVENVHNRAEDAATVDDQVANTSGMELTEAVLIPVPARSLRRDLVGVEVDRVADQVPVLDCADLSADVNASGMEMTEAVVLTMARPQTGDRMMSAASDRSGMELTEAIVPPMSRPQAEDGGMSAASDRSGMELTEAVVPPMARPQTGDRMMSAASDRSGMELTEAIVPPMSRPQAEDGGMSAASDRSGMELTEAVVPPMARSQTEDGMMSTVTDRSGMEMTEAVVPPMARSQTEDGMMSTASYRSGMEMAEAVVPPMARSQTEDGMMSTTTDRSGMEMTEAVVPPMARSQTEDGMMSTTTDRSGMEMTEGVIPPMSRPQTEDGGMSTACDRSGMEMTEAVVYARMTSHGAPTNYLGPITSGGDLNCTRGDMTGMELTEVVPRSLPGAVVKEVVTNFEDNGSQEATGADVSDDMTCGMEMTEAVGELAKRLAKDIRSSADVLFPDSSIASVSLGMKITETVDDLPPNQSASSGSNMLKMSNIETEVKDALGVLSNGTNMVVSVEDETKTTADFPRIEITPATEEKHSPIAERKSGTYALPQRDTAVSSAAGLTEVDSSLMDDQKVLSPVRSAVGLLCRDEEALGESPRVCLQLSLSDAECEEFVQEPIDAVDAPRIQPTLGGTGCPLRRQDNTYVVKEDDPDSENPTVFLTTAEVSHQVNQCEDMECVQSCGLSVGGAIGDAVVQSAEEQLHDGIGEGLSYMIASCSQAQICDSAEDHVVVSAANSVEDGVVDVGINSLLATNDRPSGIQQSFHDFSRLRRHNCSMAVQDAGVETSSADPRMFVPPTDLSAPAVPSEECSSAAKRPLVRSFEASACRSPAAKTRRHDDPPSCPSSTSSSCAVSTKRTHEATDADSISPKQARISVTPAAPAPVQSLDDADGDPVEPSVAAAAHSRLCEEVAGPSAVVVTDTGRRWSDASSAGGAATAGDHSRASTDLNDVSLPDFGVLDDSEHPSISQQRPNNTATRTRALTTQPLCDTAGILAVCDLAGSRAPCGTADSLAPCGTADSRAPCGTADSLAPCGTADSRAPCGTAASRASCGTAASHAPCGTADSRAPCGTADSLAPCGTADSRAPCGTADSLAPCGTAASHAPCGTAASRASCGTASSRASCGNASSRAPCDSERAVWLLLPQPAGGSRFQPPLKLRQLQPSSYKRHQLRQLQEAVKRYRDHHSEIVAKLS